jgi:hypothetical protein
MIGNLKSVAIQYALPSQQSVTIAVNLQAFLECQHCGTVWGDWRDMCSPFAKFCPDVLIALVIRCGRDSRHLLSLGAAMLFLIYSLAGFRLDVSR